MSAVAAIREEIARSGPIPFRRFMELALYHPEAGYYTSGRARVGRSGDFFTNVSVGPLYGRLLACQFAEMWERLGQPGDFTIVEQGAHEGHFAADTLAGLRAMVPECFAATTYRIVEPSAALAEVQRTRLREYPVAWSGSLAELPRFTGVHFSNELLDAFPVHLVAWTGEEWCERYVTMAGDGFSFATGRLSTDALRAAVEQIPLPLPPGYTTEVNVAAREWIRGVAERMDRGYVLAVDYGYQRDEYYSLERSEGTLSAYAAHQRERDPLARAGEVDLTAHVEFTSLTEAAVGAGLQLAGFTDQHHLMVGLGAALFGDHIPATDIRAFQTLMHPSLMGQSFKAIAFATAGIGGPLAGFRFARGF
jgi:SAM-dependent MidA family methyltransferase